MNKPLKVLISYNYNDTFLSCGNMLEAAFRRRDDVEVYRLGEISPSVADVAFNTLARINNYPKSAITAWWDIEACGYHVPEQFDSTLVLAPYSYHPEVYPKGKTYFFPFAYDPFEWHNIPSEFEYDAAFVGREDSERLERIEYLNYFQKNFKGTFLRTNGIRRGKEMSKLLSRAKVAMQISGDQGNVMETRFFEVGPIALLAVDRRINNQVDLDWAAVADLHYIAYSNKEEMVDKIQKFLSNDTALSHARQLAFENYAANHTYDARVQSFLETIEYVKGPGMFKFHEPRPQWEEWAKC